MALPSALQNDPAAPYTKSLRIKGAEIANQVWSSVLEVVGIYPEFVELGIRTGLFATHQACAAFNGLPVLKTFTQAMAGLRKAE